MGFEQVDRYNESYQTTIETILKSACALQKHGKHDTDWSSALALSVLEPSMCSRTNVWGYYHVSPPSMFSLRQLSIWPNRSGVFYPHFIKQSLNSIHFRFFKPIPLYSFSKIKLMFPLLNLRPKIPPPLYF